jgi:hypothetical protein
MLAGGTVLFLLLLYEPQADRARAEIRTVTAI